ncbi:MAG: hypothetical protein IJQ37_06530 [Clostridia bacterium]|nr:hypothetical protein [Clostridia bacterium]
MTAVYVICFLAIAVGVVFVFGMTPDSVTNDVMRIFEKKETLKEKALIAQGKKRSRKLTTELNRIRDALESTGKGGKFSLALTASLVLMAVGCVIAFTIGNPFLIPVLAIALAMIPFGFIRKTVASYNVQVKGELETALSIITTSYVRSDNIIESVNENLKYIKPPVREIFQSFVDECGYVSSDVKRAIKNLREKVNDTVFTEWCDILLACQDDRTLKDTLMPTVAKLTDVRIVNNEIKSTLADAKREYLIMVALVCANIPILYFLNKDWYAALMYTTLGKLVLAICSVAIFVTGIFMTRFTKPVEYRK